MVGRFAGVRVRRGDDDMMRVCTFWMNSWDRRRQLVNWIVWTFLIWKLVISGQLVRWMVWMFWRGRGGRVVTCKPLKVRNGYNLRIYWMKK